MILKSRPKTRLTAHPSTAHQFDGAPFDGAPVKPDEEWANALTHGTAALISIVAGILLVRSASSISVGMAIACGVYLAAVFATFLSSTLSHVFLKQPWLNTFRAWDQAMIYAMIVGTYTPIAFAYADGWHRIATIAPMWLAAGWGIVRKLLAKHRINSISPAPYIALGWFPAASLFWVTPWDICGMMLAGGIGYTAGVYFLMNDDQRKYYHAGWHLFVMTAAAIQYAGIWMILDDLR